MLWWPKFRRVPAKTRSRQSGVCLGEDGQKMNRVAIFGGDRGLFFELIPRGASSLWARLIFGLNQRDAMGHDNISHLFSSSYLTSPSFRR